MSKKILVFACLILSSLGYSAPSAYAFSLEGTEFFYMGNLVVITDPYYLDDDGVTHRPLNIDFKFNVHLPEYDHFCSKILGIPVNKIIQSGSQIGVKTGVLYDIKTDTFSLTPLPNPRYNSVDMLMCQSNELPTTLPGGKITYHPDGSVTVDQPLIRYKGIDYPLHLHVHEEVNALCYIYGRRVVSAYFSYVTPTTDFDYLWLNIFYESHQIYAEPNVVNTQGDMVMLVDSVTCK